MTRQSKFNLFVAVTSLLSGALCQGSEVVVPKYVASVKGEVDVQFPWSAEWRKVKAGEELPERSLVRIGPKSFAKFLLEVPDDRDSKGDTATAGVSINQPMIFRLDRITFDRLRISKHDSRLSEDVKDKANGDVADLDWNFDIRDLWKLGMVTVGLHSKGAESAADDDPYKIGVKQSPIVVLTPANNTVMASPLLPLIVDITWFDRLKIREQNSSYGIDVASSQHTDKKHFSVDDTSEFKLRIEEYGDYEVFIRDQLDNRQAKSLKFTVQAVDPKATDSAAKKQQTSAVYPTHDSLILSPPGLQWVQLDCALVAQKVTGKNRYYFSLWQTKSKKSTVFAVRRDCNARFKLPTNQSYHWSVTVLPENPLAGGSSIAPRGDNLENKFGPFTFTMRERVGGYQAFPIASALEAMMQKPQKSRLASETVIIEAK